MKNKKAAKKIAVKAETNDSEVFKKLIAEDPAAKEFYKEPGLVAYQLADGTIIEIYGAGACYPPYLFSCGNVVISFHVESISKTVLDLQKQNAVLLGQVEATYPFYKYCFLQTRENTILGLFEID